MSALEKIRAQQARLPEGSPAWAVGEQLAAICAEEPESERLVDADLDASGMGLDAAEQRIRAWADGHRTGNFAFVSPQKAEEILREFYGLPARGAGQTDRGAAAARRDGAPPAGAQPTGGTIDLLEFL